MKGIRLAALGDAVRSGNITPDQAARIRATVLRMRRDERRELARAALDLALLGPLWRRLRRAVKLRR